MILTGRTTLLTRTTTTQQNLMMDFFGLDHELSTWLFSLALLSSFQFPGMAHLQMFQVFVDHRSLYVLSRLCNRLVVVRRVLSRTMNKLLSLPNMQNGTIANFVWKWFSSCRYLLLLLQHMTGR